MRNSVASARLALFQSKRVEDLLADALRTFAKVHERSTRQRLDIANRFLQRIRDLFKTLESVWPLKMLSTNNADEDENESCCHEKKERQRALWKRSRGFKGTSQKRGTYFGLYVI